jgi:hypothetical protein
MESLGVEEIMGVHSLRLRIVIHQDWEFLKMNLWNPR